LSLFGFRLLGGWLYFYFGIWDHKILGNLELDFINILTGEPYETIVFAGENGTGKSTILEELSTFLNLGSFEFFEYIEYISNEMTYKAIKPTDGTTYKTFFDIVNENGQIVKIRSDKNNNRQSIDNNTNDIRYYGCVFSRARSDYKTKKITTTATNTVDIEKYDMDTNDDFTSLKQLLVDVSNQDNSDYMEINKTLGANPKSWDEFYPTSKVFRFKNSFDNFFDDLKYNKVTDVENEKTILFDKNNSSIPVDFLSTGEKQIVFRGIYLLKNSNILNGSAIMIDEPELSMHPKWQQKILKYYKNLFTQNEQQNAQLFFATHSEYVLKEALSNKSKNIVITLKEDNGVIQTKKIDSPSVLPSITSAETSYLAFDVVSNDYHIELYGWLQDKESKNSIKACDDFIKANVNYNISKHRKISSFNITQYDSICTYIRNAIHHPDSGNTFTEEELRCSIELLRRIHIIKE